MRPVFSSISHISASPVSEKKTGVKYRGSARVSEVHSEGRGCGAAPLL